MPSTAQTVQTVRKRRAWRAETVAGYLFVSPWIVGFVFLTAGPFVVSFVLSFTKWELAGAPQWVGLRNYGQMLGRDPRFWRSLLNTFTYVAVHVPATVLIALAAALALNRRMLGQALYRTCFYLPSVTSGVATAILWVWIFNRNFGVLNSLLRLVGRGPVPWLDSTRWAMPSLILMSLFGFGPTMVIFLAGLQSIPRHLYEAAEVDGASRWAKLRHVTVPMLSPALLFAAVIGIIDSFQVFTQAFVMTGGGPADATLFYVLHLYNNAFKYVEMGYASALAWTFFVVVLVFTVLQLRISRRWVYYEAEPPT
jgi:multiple sugar transport system permease protein